LILVLSDSSTTYSPWFSKLLVVSNREEKFSRPSKSVHFWEDSPQILAGRDMEKEGTWIGIHTDGLFAVLTNDRLSRTLPSEENKQSRGRLVSSFLSNLDVESPRDLETYYKNYLSFLLYGESRYYNGFTLLFGLVDFPMNKFKIFYHPSCASEMKLCDSCEVMDLPVAEICALCNGDLCCNWSRVVSAKKSLATALSCNKEVDSEEFWLSTFISLLSDCTRSSDNIPQNTYFTEEHEKHFSSLFVFPKWIDSIESFFGTLSSTIIMIDKDARVTYFQRDWKAFFDDHPNMLTSEDTFKHAITSNMIDFSSYNRLVKTKLRLPPMDASRNTCS